MYLSLSLVKIFIIFLRDFPLFLSPSPLQSNDKSLWINSDHEAICLFFMIQGSPFSSIESIEAQKL